MVPKKFINFWKTPYQCWEIIFQLWDGWSSFHNLLILKKIFQNDAMSDQRLIRTFEKCLNLENALLVPRWCFLIFWTHQSWFCASLWGALWPSPLLQGFLPHFFLGLLPSLLDLLVYLGGSQGDCMGWWPIVFGCWQNLHGMLFNVFEFNPL